MWKKEHPPAILLKKEHKWHSASPTTWPDTGLPPSLELHQTTNPIHNWERVSRNHSVHGHNGNQTRQWLLIPPLCSARRLTPTSIWIFHPATLLHTRLQLHTPCSPNKICSFQQDKDVDKEHFCKSRRLAVTPKPWSTNTGEPSHPHFTSTTRHAQGCYSPNDIDIPDPLWNMWQSIHWEKPTGHWTNG